MAGKGVASRIWGDGRNQRGREVIVGDLAGAALAESRGVGVDSNGVVCDENSINQFYSLTGPETGIIWHTDRSRRTDEANQIQYQKSCEAYALQA